MAVLGAWGLAMMASVPEEVWLSGESGHQKVESTVGSRLGNWTSISAIGRVDQWFMFFGINLSLYFVNSMVCLDRLMGTF